MKYKFEELQWDSDYFGVKSAKVFLNEQLDGADFQEVINITSCFEFVTITNIDNNPQNNYLMGTCSNAFLVDTNIQFQILINSKKTEQYYPINNCFPKNEIIIQIAKDSFNYSRFFNDPYLDIELSKEIYMKWVENSFQKEDKYFIIAKEDNIVFGFILFSYNNNQEIVIELISLDKKSQGKGIGTKLINTLINKAQLNDVSKIKVGTQIDNLQAMNFYAKKGFSICAKSSIYHYWPRKEILS